MKKQYEGPSELRELDSTIMKNRRSGCCVFLLVNNRRHQTEGDLRDKFFRADHTYGVENQSQNLTVSKKHSMDSSLTPLLIQKIETSQLLDQE